MKALVCALWLGCVLSASAAGYYMLSQQHQEIAATPPLPLNRYPQCSTYLITGDLWLVDDSSVVPMTNKVVMDDVLKQLRDRIEKAQAQAALFQLTNPPTARIAVKPVKYTNQFNTTDTNLGMALKLMERDHPGFATNFSPAQRTSVIRTNGGFRSRWSQRVPDYISKDSPRFRELLAEWRQTNIFPLVGSFIVPDTREGLADTNIMVPVKALPVLERAFPGSTTNLPPNRVFDPATNGHPTMNLPAGQR